MFFDAKLRWLTLAVCACLPFAPSNASEDDDDDSDDEVEVRTKVQSALLRPSPGPDSDAKGKIEVKKELSEDDPEQELEIRASDLPLGSDYFVFMEDAAGSGILVNVAALVGEDDGSEDESSDDDDSETGEDAPVAATPDEDEEDDDDADGDSADDEDDGGSFEANWNLENGEGELPFGVLDVALLEGRRVEIRDALDVTYLIGMVPSLVGNFDNDQAKLKLAGGGAAAGLLRLKANPKKGKDELELKLKGLKGRDLVTFGVEDPVTHNFVTAGVVQLKGNGKGKLKLQTKKGDPLPHEMTSVKQLGGLGFEICDPDTSEVIFQGAIPEL